MVVRYNVHSTEATSDLTTVLVSGLNANHTFSPAECFILPQPALMWPPKRSLKPKGLICDARCQTKLFQGFPSRKRTIVHLLCRERHPHLRQTEPGVWSQWKFSVTISQAAKELQVGRVAMTFPVRMCVVGPSGGNGCLVWGSPSNCPPTQSWVTHL